jgi:hypothetical protein
MPETTVRPEPPPKEEIGIGADQRPAGHPEAELLFKYYSQQWEQVRHCENMRSSFSLQLLTVAAGSVASFFYFRGCGGFQLLLSAVVVSIGVLGFLVVRALEKAANVHIWRARVVRKLLPVIEAVASTHRGFIPLAIYFLSLNAMLIVFGLVLALFALHAIPIGTPVSAFLQCTAK